MRCHEIRGLACLSRSQENVKVIAKFRRERKHPEEALLDSLDGWSGNKIQPVKMQRSKGCGLSSNSFQCCSLVVPNGTVETWHHKHLLVATPSFWWVPFDTSYLDSFLFSNRCNHMYLLYMYARTSMYIHVYKYMCTYLYTFEYMAMFVYIWMYMYRYMSKYMFMQVYMFTEVPIHVRRSQLYVHLVNPQRHHSHHHPHHHLLYHIITTSIIITTNYHDHDENC